MIITLLALAGLLLSVILLLPEAASWVQPELLDLGQKAVIPGLFFLVMLLGFLGFLQRKKSKQTLQDEKENNAQLNTRLTELTEEQKRVQTENDQLKKTAQAGESALYKATFEHKKMQTAYEEQKLRNQELQQKLGESATISAGAMVAELLALLQQKGRFIDFIKDDITRYADAQVGAAARIVHQGCAAVIKEYFTVEPIRNEAEGSTITLSENFSTSQYRLLGKVKDEPPFNGRLLHHGWMATRIELPKPVANNAGVLTPAEVELV